MQLNSSRSRPATPSLASLSVAAAHLLLASLSTVAASADTSPAANGLQVGGSGTQPSYEPEFALFDRGIVGRAPPGVLALKNNIPEILSLAPGQTACFMIEKSVLFGAATASNRLELRDAGPDPADETEGSGNEHGRRQDGEQTTTIYLSANTCQQPRVVSPNGTDLVPPQLVLSISGSAEAGCPDPSQSSPGLQWTTFKEGAAMLSADVTEEVFIGVTTPNISTGYQDVYQFEIAASIDEYYHRYESGESKELFWMDSDSSSVLLVTKNLTQNIDEVSSFMKGTPPYELFVHNEATNPINGLKRSVCGLRNSALISANPAGNGKLNNLVRTGLTVRGPGGLPKQQFYFQGLNSSSSYSAILVKTNSNTVSKRQDGGTPGGGGTVLDKTPFQTGSGSTCTFITDLEFCDEVQWSVPGNGDLDSTALAKVYDDYAKEMYASFEKVMMQIPCEAEPTSRYSLARSCENCTAAYKRWLCTVSMPRCAEFDTDNQNAIPRNVGQPFPNGTSLPTQVKDEFQTEPGNNASRNSFIDETIQPGPYKEILPCEDVCYEIVQSCPAALGFACPRPGRQTFRFSYGERTVDDPPSCNSLGQLRTRSSMATVTAPRGYLLSAIALFASMHLVLG